MLVSFAWKGEMVKSEVSQQPAGCLLGLPNVFTSKFKVSADFTKSELEQLTEWERCRTFYQVRESRKCQAKFILHDGPPYANGKAHAGHAVNKILKDTITKHKTLSGLDAPLILGWDCHGMPIEAQMTEAAQSPLLSSRLTLIREARSYANQQAEEQYEDLRHLGLLVSKAESYLTMDKPTEAQEAKLFQSLLLGGTIRRGTKPLDWCSSCKTNLAEAEVKSQQSSRTGATLTFPFFRSKANFRKTKKLLGITTEEAAGGMCVWTTTPWTVTANRALSSNPNDGYILAKADQNLVTCSVGMIDQFVRDSEAELTILRIIRGDATSQLKFQHPFGVLLTKFCSPLNPILDPTIRSEGTGSVHIAPAHSIDDFRLCQLLMPSPLTNSVTGSGSHKSILLRRKKVTSAGIVSLTWVNFTRNLVKCKVSDSAATKCHRHQTETIVRSLTQWFLDASQQVSGPTTWKAKVLGSLRDTGFPFEVDRRQLVRAVTARPDWCLTRQKCWGVPILIVENKMTKNLHPFAVGMMNAVINEMRLLGIEAWTGACLLNFRREESGEYRKAPDTLDVWFDSGTTWHMLKSNPLLAFPADLYLEGADQFRGWFYSSLVTSVMLTSLTPTRSFISHGFVINDQGEKLSKSTGNCGSLTELVRKEGADVLRLLVTSLDCRKDLRLTDECLRSASDCYRKLRNTFKFLLSNLSDFTFQTDCLPSGSLVGIDAYFLLKTRDAQSEMRKQSDLYNWSGSVKLLVQFCVRELGKFYFEVLKGRLYSSSRRSFVRKSAQSSLHYITNFLLKSAAPLLPFSTEEAWHSFRPGRGSVLKEHYHSYPAFNRDLLLKWEPIIPAREENIRIVGTMRDRRVVGNSSAVTTKLSDGFPRYCQLLLVGSELGVLLSTSKTRLIFRIRRPNHIVRNLRPTYDKCTRCWLRLPTSCGSSQQSICSACKWSLQSKGEGRRLM